jgi:hypothetical protein
VATITIQQAAASAIDTHVRENAATTNYATDVGMDTLVTAGSRRLCFIKFDVSGIPAGSKINSATLSLYNESTSTSTKNFPVHAILSANSAWTETGATWNYATGTTRWAGDTDNNGGTNAGCSVSGTDYNATACCTINYAANDAANTECVDAITAATVQAWVDGANYGLIVLPTGTSGFYWRTSDNSTATGPKLYVDYTPPASGTLSQTLDAATVSASGTVASSGANGALSQTLGAITISGAGTVSVSGILSATLEGLGRSAAGGVSVSGTTNATLEGIGKSLAGAVGISGSAAKTLDGITIGAAGSVGTVVISGALSITLDGITRSAAGQVAVAGTLSKTLDDITRSAAGQVAVAGTLSKTLDGITRSAAGTVEIKAAASLSLASVSGSILGTVAINGAGSKTLDSLITSIAGVVGNPPITGSLAKTLDGLAISSAGDVDAAGSLAKTLDGIGITGAGTVEIRVGLAKTLDGLVIGAVGTVTGTGQASEDLWIIAGVMIVVAGSTSPSGAIVPAWEGQGSGGSVAGSTGAGAADAEWSIDG